MKISPQSPCQKMIKGPLFQAMNNNSFMSLGIHSAYFLQSMHNSSSCKSSSLPNYLRQNCAELEAGSSESSIWTK